MNPDALFDLLRAAILAVILAGTLRLLISGKSSLRVVFFAFGTACLLLCDIYWLAYDALLPGARMPFAANELGEWAMFLLFGASLTCGQPIGFENGKKEAACAMLFAAASGALWYGWSGEWIQDIFTALAYGSLLCALVCRMKEHEAFSELQLRLTGAACAALIFVQTMTFFGPKQYFDVFDRLSYVILFPVAFLFVAKAVASLKKDVPQKSVCCSFAAYAWSVTTLYMSDGGFYSAAMALSGICLALMFLSIKKEVTAP